jgi:hypothetical protein
MALLTETCPLCFSLIVEGRLSAHLASVHAGTAEAEAAQAEAAKPKGKGR